MKIAFIYQDKKLKIGTNYINTLIAEKLKAHRVEVTSFYPTLRLVDTPHHMKGLNNILFFFSLLEHRKKILACDIIQGTTYTPIAFLSFTKPIVSHFGSTTYGFITQTPLFNKVEPPLKKIWQQLRKDKVLTELDLKTRRPLRDIADIEKLVAKRATAVIATSQIVKDDLINNEIAPQKIHVVHNAIEDFWFKNTLRKLAPPSLVYLGRIGQDVFTLKLKGLDRLVYVYRQFPNVPKTSIIMTGHKKLTDWLKTCGNSHTVYANLYKNEVKELLQSMRGSILLVTSRYEGFCLSLIEGMSQGLIPVSFPIGVAPEIIKNGQNGYLVNSVKEMTEKVDFIVHHFAMRQKLSAAAMKTAKQFRSEIMVKKLVTIYKDILKVSRLSKN